MKQINNSSTYPQMIISGKTNEYLRIILEDNKVRVLAYDGVFGYGATLEDWDEYERYCDEKANDWISCPYANYDSYNKEDKEKKSKKWLEAKNLREGAYEYYFNLGDLKECFRNEVAELAKRMGITIEANDEDIEKEVTNWWNEYYGCIKKNYTFEGYTGHYMENSTIISLAKHFYELGQLNAQKEECITKIYD